MIFLTVLISLAAFAVLAVVLYLYILGLNGIFVYRNAQSPVSCDNKKFLVFVPAHDEAVVIRRAVESIRNTDYDQSLIDVYVIADNCTDATPEIAREAGAVPLERHDLEKFGKGYAIEWALSQIDIDKYDAVSVIDADNVVEANFFKVNAGLLESGKEIIQSYFGYFNVAKTTYSYILYLANLIENILLYNSRSSLNLHVFLRGSGMVFKTEVLHQVPWQSKSITEDVNYSIDLIANDKKIHFTALTRVREEALNYINQSFNQRLRYNTGIINLIKNNCFSLFKLGLKKKDIRLLESSVSFFLLSKPMLLFLSVLTLAVNLLVDAGELITIISLFNIVAISVYFGLGVFLKPEKGPLVKTILTMPFYGLWLIIIYVLSSFGYKKGVWVRTPRMHDTKKHPPIL